MPPLIGREDSNVFGQDTHKASRWIGKPWRRAELLTHRHTWLGKTTVTDRDLTLHLGSRRLGVAVTLSLTWSPGTDYSEERP